MEDRKRPSPYDHNDSAPPLKKQATSANGASKSHDTDMPWKDDLERIQKDAIHRQMLEYKREKSNLESQLKEMRRKARHHDEHLRIIDTWFEQLIDEVKMLVPGEDEAAVDFSLIPSSLLFADQEKFEEHLRTRSNDIRAVMKRIFSHTKNLPPDVIQLQARLAKLLAVEKEHLVELEKCRVEVEESNERLENASLRYMMAEKKLDRARSLTAAKLDRQALMGASKSNTEDGGTVKKEETMTNGVNDNSDALAEMEEQHNKVLAVSEKQKEQLEKLEEDNAKLLSELTELKTKAATPSDEEYAKTELFKHFKAQHEDVIKRVNDLEARNIQLREEAVKLQSERTSFRSQLESESRAAIAEKGALLGAVDANLARIRSNRDELLADQAVKKARLEAEHDSIVKAKELSSAYEERISALESENGRLSMQAGSIMVEESALDSLGLEELRARYRELDRKYTMLNGELASMSTAFQKASKLASQKVADHSALEEKVQRLLAEKAKADQKFFAAMKSKDTRDSEVRTLRMQNTKSSEVVAQLKESETATRALLANLEKQLAETKDALTNKMNEHRTSQAQLTANTHETSKLNAQIAELKKILASKDTKQASTESACRAAELEVAELKSTLVDTCKSLEGWKAKGLSGHSEQYEMLRTIAYCNICKRDLKDTVIKTCGHTFCKNCVEERLTSRSRKCPNCGKSFGSNDHMKITL